MNRTQRLTGAIGVFAIVTVLGAAAGAQEPKKSAQPANPPSVVSAVAPEAAALIDRMGTYLQTISAFGIHAETTTDEVLLVGPKVQFGGTIDGTFRAPDGLRLRVAHDDADPQEFFYNGSAASPLSDHPPVNHKPFFGLIFKRLEAVIQTQHPRPAVALLLRCNISFRFRINAFSFFS